MKFISKILFGFCENRGQGLEEFVTKCIAQCVKSLLLCFFLNSVIYSFLVQVQVTFPD